MITWYKEVKFLYVVFINTIFFIVLNLLCNMFIKLPLNNYFYLLNLSVVLTSKYLSYKTFYTMEKRKKLILLGFSIYLIISPVIIYFSSIKIFLVNLIYILFMLGVVNEYRDDIINHDEYKERIIKSFILIIIIGIFMSTFYYTIFKEMVIFYFFSIVISIFLLRESRNYDYKIKNKNSKYVNIAIGIVVMLFSVEPVYNWFYYVVIIIKNFLDKILDKILDFVMLVVFVPLSPIIEKLRMYFISKYNERNQPKLIEYGIQISNKNIKANGVKPSFLDTLLVNTVIKLVLIFMIIYIIYKIYKFFMDKVRYSSSIQDEEDIIEKIIPKKKKQFNFFKSFLNNKKDRRGVILEIYKKFLKASYKKNLFKKYMTATVLSNVLKIHIDKNKELEDLSTIYNKAKFSLHEVSKEDLEKIKKSYEVVNNKLNKL